MERKWRLSQWISYDLGSGINGEQGALSCISPVAINELETITLTLNIGESQ
jgi:hypothetical protein